MIDAYCLWQLYKIVEWEKHGKRHGGVTEAASRDPFFALRSVADDVNKMMKLKSKSNQNAK